MSAAQNLVPGAFPAFVVSGHRLVIFDGGLSAGNYRTRVGGSKAGLGQGCNGLVSCTGAGTQGRDLKPPTAQSLGFQTPSSMGSMGLINLYLASPISQAGNPRLPHVVDDSCSASVVGFWGKELAMGRHCWGTEAASHLDSPGMVSECTKTAHPRQRGYIYI